VHERVALEALSSPQLRDRATVYERGESRAGLTEVREATLKRLADSLEAGRDPAGNHLFQPFLHDVIGRMDADLAHRTVA
jgi:hypothetical protein